MHFARQFQNDWEYEADELPDLCQALRSTSCCARAYIELTVQVARHTCRPDLAYVLDDLPDACQAAGMVGN